jgi:hypothetical protein
MKRNAWFSFIASLYSECLELKRTDYRVVGRANTRHNCAVRPAKYAMLWMKIALSCEVNDALQCVNGFAAA